MNIKRNRYYINFILGCALTLFLFDCTGLAVDTLNKRVAVFEIGYNQTLVTIKLWITEGRLKGTDKVSIQSRVKEMSVARHAMHAAKKLGDLDTVAGQLNAANISLQLLRDYITSQEKVPI